MLFPPALGWTDQIRLSARSVAPCNGRCTAGPSTAGPSTAAGLVSKVHANLDCPTGYYLSGDISHERMQVVLQQSAPYVTCTRYQTTPVAAAIGNLIEVPKQRRAPMKCEPRSQLPANPFNRL